MEPSTEQASATDEQHPRHDGVDDAVERLSDATRLGIPCRPVRDLIGADDVTAAYAVQERLTSARIDRGGVVVGRKIGLTSEVVQRQLGVDRPDFGVLFADMERHHHIATPDLLQPKVEAEVAFVLGADLDEGPITTRHVREAVREVVAALEIVDSRIAEWDITFADTVADNASSGLFVLGKERHSLVDVEPIDVTMTLVRDGEVVSEGNGRACLGDPVEALRWLAQTALDLGDPLRAGQVVLSGALGPMVPVTPGATFVAHISGLGDVTATFSNEEGALA